MLEVHLQLATRLQAGGPTRVGPEEEGRHAACWFSDSSAIDTEDVLGSGRRLGYVDADWDVD